MIQALGPESQGSSRSSRANADLAASQDISDPEYLLNPVDRGSKSAPIVVMREISQHVTLGYRRVVSGDPDLVQLQLLDEQSASELIELFIKHQGHTLLVRSHEELRHYGDARQLSAFLHSVCCLIGVVYRDDICGTPLHRQVYEQVRVTLGQAVLCSPLDLDDLNAMFIMSNNANTPSSQGVEYIDSWLLTGYCAKQAMLSIYFTQIVDRLKNGNSTVGDHQAMHLWSTICLHHLQWAATTGRPSTIPKGSHINQCNVLLSFYQATMQDGMLVAEIMLFSVLHEKLLQESYPSDGRECEEFRTWKQRWNHLLALPTSAMLRIGYNAACLILAVRALGKTGDAPGSTSLLSTDSNPVTGNVMNDNSPVSFDHRGINSSDSGGAREETLQLPSDPRSDNTPADILRVNVCNYAKIILETFLEMPSILRDTAPTCTCLCLGYCALVLAHYDVSQSHIPNDVVLRLIMRLDRWVRTSPGKAWSYKYGTLAIRKVETRINSPTSPNLRAETDLTGQTSRVYDDERGASQHCQADSLDHSGTEHANNYRSVDMLASTGHSDGANDTLPPFDLDTMFPSMEGFFGGGFLDFMR
ncbi:hypothetical protein F4808DRAFT_343049 [Astrocystis sublimbata]|nr:hypothetical protein F4808DRAFT_343049 [Astrocystis sublimbata]